jgi:hypothetical protein
MQHSGDGKVYLEPQVAALLCSTTTKTLRDWRYQENPPPYHPDLKMYPATDLGIWIRTELIFKKGRGGTYPNLPDLSRIPGRGAMPTGASDSPEPITKNDAEIRLKTLQADKVEIELKQAAAELIPVDEVTRALTNMAMRVKTRLLRIPTSLAPLITGLTDVHAVQKRLEQDVREALEELSMDWRDGQDSDKDDE